MPRRTPTDVLLEQVRACEICAADLPFGPRPVLQMHPEARILIAGQAPGRRVHESGVPFEDPSGDARVEKGLTQVPWRRAWTRLGHLGGHIGWLSRRWTREVLAPYLAGEHNQPERPASPAATTRQSER